MGPNYTGFQDGALVVKDTSTSRSNLGLGSIATQNAANVALTGGAIDGTTLGATTPSTAIFSDLSWPVRASLISVNTEVSPTTDLSRLFQVNTAAVNMTAQVIGNYQTGFQFWIKNTSVGSVTFTPNGADNIDGTSSLSIAPNECVQIAKSLTANKWEVVSNYNSGTAGGYLLAANNLSDVSSRYTSTANLGFSGAAASYSSAIDVTLTNPMPAQASVTMSVDANKVILAVANAAQSLSHNGGIITIYNAGSTYFSIYKQDGSTLIHSTLLPSQRITLYCTDNSTANGTWVVGAVVGSLGAQQATAVAISGGFIQGTTIGNITPAAATFTYIASNLLSTTTGVNYLVDPVADKFTTIYTTATIDITLQAWANYDPGFTFIVSNITNSTTAAIHAPGGETINGATTVTANENQSLVIQKSTVAGKWSIWAECRSTSLGLVAPSAGGTGINNGSFTLTVGANSSINQDVSTTASPTFANVTLSNAGALRTTTTTAQTVLFQAYDVNNTTYRTFATLTAGNTPDFTLQNPSGGTLNIIDATLISAQGVINSDTYMQSVSFRQATVNGDLGILNTGTSTSAASIAVTSTTGGITLTPASGKVTTIISPSILGMINATTVVSGTSQAAAVNNAYYSNNAGLVTITLPSTAAVGDVIEVGGLGAGGWRIAQNASQLIHLGSSVTTTGVGGRLDSTNQYDSVTLRCVVANTTFNVVSAIGNITVT